MVNRHALNHFEETKHPLAMDLDSKACHCYICDEFVHGGARETDLNALREEIGTIVAGGGEGCREEMTGDGARTADRESWCAPRSAGRGTIAGGDAASAGIGLVTRRETRGRKKGPPGKKYDHVTGLSNLGNTCFMNVMLQTLAHTVPFRKFYLEDPPPSASSTRPQSPNPLSAPSPDAQASSSSTHSPPADPSCPSLSRTSSMTAPLSEEIPSSPPRNPSPAPASVSTEASTSAPALPPTASPSQEAPPSAPAPPVRASSTTDPSNEISIWDQTCQLLRDMWEGTAIAVSPDSFLTSIFKIVPMFRGYQQQDAQEFIRYLLDRIHTELSRKSSKTVIVKVFQGLLHNEVTCRRCGHVSTKMDPFLDVSLPIPERFVTKRNRGEATANPCTLEDCLRAFTEVEELDDSELYECNSCRSKERCSKRLLIERLPEVLCLHLKRFRFTRESVTRNSRAKVETFVQFPVINLDMGPYTRQRVKGVHYYSLYSVIIHYGSSGSGHFVAFLWSEEHQCWFEMNDSQTKPIKEEELMRQAVYMLFYLRTEKKLVGGVDLDAEATKRAEEATKAALEKANEGCRAAGKRIGGMVGSRGGDTSRGTQKPQPKIRIRINMGVGSVSSSAPSTPLSTVSDSWLSSSDSREGSAQPVRRDSAKAESPKRKRSEDFGEPDGLSKRGRWEGTEKTGRSRAAGGDRKRRREEEEDELWEPESPKHKRKAGSEEKDGTRRGRATTAVEKGPGRRNPPRCNGRPPPPPAPPSQLSRPSRKRSSPDSGSDSEDDTPLACLPKRVRHWVPAKRK
ncbi:Ubiquitin carboxyl-terminal hydrolase 3, partial [Borealophlyctis nickersoniae]